MSKGTGRRSWVVSVVAMGLAVGCGGRAADDGEPGDNTGSSTQKLERCDNLGDFDLTVSWGRLAPYEGVQATLFTTKNVGRDVGDLYVTRTITKGRFEASCVKALVEDFSYPGLALFIDADGDGRCTSADIFGAEVFYGWAGDLQSGSFEYQGQGTGGSRLMAEQACELWRRARHAAEQASSSP